MHRILKLLTLNIEFNDNLSYRRIILVSSILFVTVFVFLFFGTTNYIVAHNIPIAAMDFAAATISAFAIYHLRKHKNVILSAKLATINLIFFFITFIYINGSTHFALIWTVFLPIFATLTNGKRVGLYFSFAFYAILFPLAYLNIGVWEDGDWLLQDTLRLYFASMILMFTMYMNEEALEESDRELSKIRLLEKHHIKELREKSIKDQLTGLYNRRYYNEMLPKLISLAKRKKHLITFFILDVDFFKNYNDAYGHIKGDETLVNIATTIQQHIQRDDDFVFRLGGEEFAGIIISDDQENTHQWIAKICSVIEKLKIEHRESSVAKHVTVSIGLATICCDKDYDMDKLYSFADQALYIAKNRGRNRSEISIECSKRSANA